MTGRLVARGRSMVITCRLTGMTTTLGGARLIWGPIYIGYIRLAKTPQLSTEALLDDLKAEHTTEIARGLE